MIYEDAKSMPVDSQTSRIVADICRRPRSRSNKTFKILDVEVDLDPNIARIAEEVFRSFNERHGKVPEHRKDMLKHLECLLSRTPRGPRTPSPNHCNL